MSTGNGVEASFKGDPRVLGAERDWGQPLPWTSDSLPSFSEGLLWSQGWEGS